jgi:hypothetical protein
MERPGSLRLCFNWRSKELGFEPEWVFRLNFHFSLSKLATLSLKLNFNVIEQYSPAAIISFQKLVSKE